MFDIDELIEQVKGITLTRVVEKNREFIRMKYNEFDSNVTLGRTFSLGQWFGFYLGLEISKELPDHEVLVDTCLSTLKQYNTKQDPSKNRKKSYYPDILIVQKIAHEGLDYKNYSDLIQQNERVIKRYKINLDYKITVYDVKALIELKLDPGYVDPKALSNSFSILNCYIDTGEEFSFKKVYPIEGTKDQFNIQHVVRFNAPIVKTLILATEANHVERITGIRSVCKEQGFKYISLTKKSKHIRDIKDVAELKEMLTVEN